MRDSLVALSTTRPPVPVLADEDVFDGLSRRMDPGHAVVLRGLLDTGDPPGSEGHLELLSALSTRFAALRRESVDRLDVLRTEIPDRLSESVLGKRMEEAGFYRHDSLWTTHGKGGRKDLRAIFLLCFRELVADVERVLVQCQSRSDHLDELASRQWLERPASNGQRVGACLAEGLRTTESQRLKSWRSSLGRSGEDGFCQAMAGCWEKLSAPSRAALHQLAARPWSGPRHDGFQGFALALIDHAQALADAMVWLSQSRWEIHLRALAPSSTGDHE
ncbi:MAG: hypothetical protein IPN71_20605 [Fibrobacteres bacterium]|nr:hypothetical protein [Fibrobacterota bacterium]